MTILIKNRKNQVNRGFRNTSVIANQTGLRHCERSEAIFKGLAFCLSGLPRHYVPRNDIWCIITTRNDIWFIITTRNDGWFTITTCNEKI